MRRNFLFLGISLVHVQSQRSRKHPLRPGRNPKITGFSRPATAKTTEIAARRGQPPVHQGNAMRTVYPARTVQNAKVIGRRWSRWSIGAIDVRSHPSFRPDESRNAMRTVPPRPAEPTPKGPFCGIFGGGGGEKYRLLRISGSRKKIGFDHVTGGCDH